MTTPDIAGLCERLRETRSVWSEAKEASIKRRRNPDGPEAADTLERQAAEIERLRGALEPFAKTAALFDTGDYVNHDACIYRPAAGDEYSLSSGHLLAARAALTGEES
jgi:hypothetical protein